MGGPSPWVAGLERGEPHHHRRGDLGCGVAESGLGGGGSLRRCRCQRQRGRGGRGLARRQCQGRGRRSGWGREGVFFDIGNGGTRRRHEGGRLIIS
ncbi:hypothetical protein TIFTF001_002474 [Ficus carica]|uniref:Uncharacterized protein n=1 Tax=Ficus carica TaxID=3494 RepID=A0AA87ZN04_FICCA|nr:hypothetical protein TIFTF001_002474 [Ficus carica]